MASAGATIYTVEVAKWIHRCLVMDGPAGPDGSTTSMSLYKSGALDYMVSPCNFYFTPPTEAFTLHSGAVPLKIDELRYGLSSTCWLASFYTRVRTR